MKSTKWKWNDRTNATWPTGCRMTSDPNLSLDQQGGTAQNDFLDVGYICHICDILQLWASIPESGTLTRIHIFEIHEKYIYNEHYHWEKGLACVELVGVESALLTLQKFKLFKILRANIFAMMLCTRNIMCWARCCGQSGPQPLWPACVPLSISTLW